MFVIAIVIIWEIFSCNRNHSEISCRNRNRICNHSKVIGPNHGDILHKCLVDQANVLYPDGWVFQKDNNPKIYV